MVHFGMSWSPFMLIFIVSKYHSIKSRISKNPLFGSCSSVSNLPIYCRNKSRTSSLFWISFTSTLLKILQQLFPYEGQMMETGSIQRNENYHYWHDNQNFPAKRMRKFILNLRYNPTGVTLSESIFNFSIFNFIFHRQNLGQKKVCRNRQTFLKFKHSWDYDLYSFVQSNLLNLQYSLFSFNWMDKSKNILFFNFFWLLIKTICDPMHCKIHGWWHNGFNT